MTKRNNIFFRWNLLGLPTSAIKDWKLHRITLAFTGKIHNYEEIYREDYFNRSLNPFRFSIILAIIFFDVFAILDATVLPDLKNIFWFIRFGVITPILVLVFFLSYSKSFKKYMQLVIAGIMYITGLGIIVMIFLAARLMSHYTYYAGLILIFIFGYTFIRARFIFASIAGWSIVLSYEISAIFLLDTPPSILINNNYFFISANIIGMFISYFLEVSSRRDFYMRLLLEEEQKKVQSANNALEKRVEERTKQLTAANKDLKKEIEMRQKEEKERIRLETQLLQLQKMETIGTLAGGVAHDFNNILTPILGYTEMALEELSQESTLRYDIEQINNAALRGKDLVQQILTFSRQVDFDKKPIQLAPIIMEALNLSKASFPSNIKIKYDLDPNCGSVLADASQMHQIIMNLFTNSYHAMMNGGGVLEVKLFSKEIKPIEMKESSQASQGTYVCLVVIDSGHGMDKQTMERIFEPFFTSKDVGMGSGLGLSVVHGIVKNNGGFIDVESKKGAGAKFTIYLPQHSANPVNFKSTSAKMNRGKGCILFVDDEKEITYMGKKMLESLGYIVEIRTDGLTALQEIRNNPDKYDLLVTDQSMPNMLGTELIAEARRVMPNLKTIVITGYYEALPANAKTNLKISEILLKPIILSDFSNHIHNVINENNGLN